MYAFNNFYCSNNNNVLANSELTKHLYFNFQQNYLNLKQSNFVQVYKPQNIYSLNLSSFCDVAWNHEV